MSRVGKKPILITQGVEVKLEGQRVNVKGSKGELSREIRPEIKVEVKEGKIFVLPKKEEKKKKLTSRQAKRTRAFWGLTRALLNEMLKGVTLGFEKKLEIEGLGYKAILEGNDLLLHIGYTNPVKVKAPVGVKFSIEKNIITISGIDKELVGQTAAKIKKLKVPDPYRAKGIKYLGEVIKRKAGKKVVTTGPGGA